MSAEQVKEAIVKGVAKKDALSIRDCAKIEFINKGDAKLTVVAPDDASQTEIPIANAYCALLYAGKINKSKNLEVFLFDSNGIEILINFSITIANNDRTVLIHKNANIPLVPIFIPIGSYQVTISKEGYEPITETCAVIAENESTTCSILLPKIDTVQTGCKVSLVGEDIFLENGESVITYSTPTAQTVENCIDQQRICNNGSLSGSFVYKNCKVTSEPLPIAAPFLNRITSLGPGQAKLEWSFDTSKEPEKSYTGYIIYQIISVEGQEPEVKAIKEITGIHIKSSTIEGLAEGKRVFFKMVAFKGAGGKSTGFSNTLPVKIASTPITPPETAADLSISALTITPATVDANETITINATVINNGDAASTNTALTYFYTGHPSKTTCASIPVIAPFTSTNGECTITAPSKGGNYTYSVCVEEDCESKQVFVRSRELS